MSGFSKTTQGGVGFDELCEGEVKNYSFNPAVIKNEKKVKHIKRKLVRKLEDTITALQIGSERTIAKIYIGKTFIRQRRKPGGGYRTFKPEDHHTWKKNGISSRWQDHKHEDYGRDGLVVLGAITRETMPERCRGRVHQEDFALAMEQKLLHHYLLSHPDPRVINESFSTGQATKDKSYAYAVYMAFRYEDEDDKTTSEDTAFETSTPPFPLREESEPRSPSPIDQAMQLDPSTSSPQRQQERAVTPPQPILKRTTPKAREEDNTPLPSPTGSQDSTPATPSRPTPSPPPRKRLKLTSPSRDSSTSSSLVRSPLNTPILKATSPFSSIEETTCISYYITPLPPRSCKKKLSLNKRRSPSSTSTSKKKQSSPNTRRSPINKRQQPAGIGNLNPTGSTPPAVRKLLSLSTKQKRPSKAIEQRSTCSPSNSAASETSQPYSKTRSPQAREGLQLSSLAANEENASELSSTPLKSPTKSDHNPLSQPRMSTPENPAMADKDTNIRFNKEVDNNESAFTPSIQSSSSFERDFQNQSDSQKCHQSYIMQKYLASLPEPVVTNSDVIDLTKED